MIDTIIAIGFGCIGAWCGWVISQAGHGQPYVKPERN